MNDEVAAVRYAEADVRQALHREDSAFLEMIGCYLRIYGYSLPRSSPGSSLPNHRCDCDVSYKSVKIGPGSPSILIQRLLLL